MLSENVENSFEIIVPQNNENNLLKRCKELNIKSVLFLYNLNDIEKKEVIRENKKNKEYGIYIKEGVIINDKISVNFLKNLKRKYKFIALNILTNHEIFLNNINLLSDLFIFNLELSEKPDFIHQKNSNLNNTIAKQINLNNIEVIFSFLNYSKSDIKTKINTIGRIKQNIKICNKFNIKYHISSFATRNIELKSSLDSIKYCIEKK